MRQFFGIALSRLILLGSLWCGAAGFAAPAPAVSGLPAAAIGQSRYHFREPTTPALDLGAGVLTEDERAFVAALPEIRVAVPLLPSRPYDWIADDGEVSGIHPEMLAYLARAFGLRLKPVVLPDWDHVLEAAKRRDVDLLMTLGVTTERAGYLAFTLGATPLPGALFALKSGAGGPPPPNRARFALERAYMTNDVVRRQFPDATIVTADNTGDALAAVGEGRADYYLGSLLEAVDWLGRRPQPGVQLHSMMPYGTGYYHFAVRDDWARLAVILNKGIATLRATSTPQLNAALGALPASVALPRLAPLDTRQAALLVQHPLWRVGAVRGLAMLNDIDVRGLHSGIASEYAEQVAQHLGVGMQVVPFDNVAAMLDGLRGGQIDLVPFLTRTPEREREFTFSSPYMEMPYMIVARSDAPLYWDLNSLRGKRLALALAHPLRGVLARRYPDIVIVDTANGNEALDAVADRRADAAVEVKLFANLRIHGDNDGRLRAVASVTDLPAQFHFAASARSRALIPVVDKALAQIPDAEHERMLRRWIALDLDPAFPWRRYLPMLALAGTALLALGGGTAWWMRRLHREVAARRRSEERLSDIGATLPCVAFRYVVSADGRLKATYYSDGAKALLGIELDPARTILDNIAPRTNPEHWRQAERAQRESRQCGGRFKATVAYAHPDGRERWLHAEAVSKAGDDGATVWTGYVVDMSSERELQARVAREADARNVMLASASHELRAPTHTLTLALQSLADAADSGDVSDQARTLRVAKDAARTLAQLLDDVLDAARLDHGGLQLRPQVFALHDLLEQVADSTHAWSAAKGLAFDMRIDDGVPSTVRLDPLRLRQTLTNLLSNAVKYTDRGHVGLHVGAQDASDGAVHLVFTVSDTGRGIEPAQVERLFQPFATADAAAAVPEGSSGLGLSICRQLAGLMGGSVTLRSEPGQGTQVQLLVPLERPIGLRGERAPVIPAEGVIVICDDDDTGRLLLAHMLLSRGYPVVECATAQDALLRWRAGGVQAIVTDLDMQGMDGRQLMRQIRDAERSGPPGAGTRIVVCSGHPVPPEEPGGAAQLHDAWLAKPVELPVLLGALDALGILPAGAPHIPN